MGHDPQSLIMKQMQTNEAGNVESMHVMIRVRIEIRTSQATGRDAKAFSAQRCQWLLAGATDVNHRRERRRSCPASIHEYIT